MTTSSASMKKPLFEHRTCSRCGGSGHYSYCQMYGTTCFKCAGWGATLTKRGRAAQNFLNKLRSVAIGTLKVGDRYWFDGVPGLYADKIITVIGVEPDAANGGITVVGVDARGEGARYGGNPETATVRKVWTKGEIAAFRTEALAFQATLTKTGTVRKRKEKAKTEGRVC